MVCNIYREKLLGFISKAENSLCIIVDQRFIHEIPSYYRRVARIIWHASLMLIFVKGGGCHIYHIISLVDLVLVVTQGNYVHEFSKVVFFKACGFWRASERIIKWITWVDQRIHNDIWSHSDVFCRWSIRHVGRQVVPFPVWRREGGGWHISCITFHSRKRSPPLPHFKLVVWRKREEDGHSVGICITFHGKKRSPSPTLCEGRRRRMVHHSVGRGVTGKFFWVGKVTFPDFFSGMKCFFPGRKFPFWYTQNKS